MGMVRPDLLSWWVFGDTLVFKLVGGAPFFCGSDKAKTSRSMKIVKEKTIAFTGNRSLTSRNGNQGTALKMIICDHLYAMLEREYLENGINTMLCGMALGFDTIAALVTVQLKRKYKDIRFIAVVPFAGQEAKFSDKDIKVYQHLLVEADEIITISDTFSNQAYHDRNDFLIEHASKMYAYHNGKPRSGTGSTIRKAHKQGVEVVNLYEII